MFKRLFTKEVGFVFAISVLPVFAVYLPFLLGIRHFFFLDLKESGILQLVRNWDGPHYLVVAKSFYDPKIIKLVLFAPVDLKYYAAHFPLFPLFIRLFIPVFGWFYSGFVVNLLFGFLANVLFYNLAKKYTKFPLFLTFVFTVFPPRFWVVRSIISPETLMVFCILLSLWLWDNKNYFSSSLAGAAALLTKLQAGFLFPAYAAATVEQYFKEKKLPSLKTFWIFLIPAAFVALSGIFYLRYGDFMAFFHAESGNNLYMTFPFSQYNYMNTWTGTGWLEDVVFYTVAFMTLIVTLWKRKERVWFYFALFYTIFLIFIPQRDITRFSFQLAPLFLLTFEQFFTSKAFKYGLILSLPALYFYTLNFIMTNQASVADWNHFLK